MNIRYDTSLYIIPRVLKKQSATTGKPPQNRPPGPRHGNRRLQPFPRSHTHPVAAPRPSVYRQRVLAARQL